MEEKLSMFKIGDRVEIKGGSHKGQKGTIRRRCKISNPPEPQENGWEVELSYGAYKFYEEQLRKTTD